MNSIKEGHICRPPGSRDFFWNFNFDFPGLDMMGELCLGALRLQGMQGFWAADGMCSSGAEDGLLRKTRWGGLKSKKRGWKRVRFFLSGGSRWRGGVCAVEAWEASLWIWCVFIYENPTSFYVNLTNIYLWFAVDVQGPQICFGWMWFSASICSVYSLLIILFSPL